MSERLSLSLSPIAHWAVVGLVASALVALTLWPYRARLVASGDRRKYVVVGLRMLAIVLALLACLRPSLLVVQRVRQRVSVLLMLDSSSSMKISDEANSSSRWDAARRVLADAMDAFGEIAGDGDEEGLDVKAIRFDGALHPGPPPEGSEPEGLQTALGANLIEAVRAEAGAPVASLILLSDGASNKGLPPLIAAQNLRAQGVPITVVGFGSAAAGAASRDVAVTGVQGPEAVFVKNELEVRGALRVRGFAGRDLDVELMAEGLGRPVARARVRVPADSEVLTTPPLRYAPQAVPPGGDALLTLRVKPVEGELLDSNNSYSTFVNVLPGGLDVLHLQGPGTIWEGKFVSRALDASREIQSSLRVVLGPGRADQPAIPDADFAPGAHDVYILGDVPAGFLTTRQHALLARRVEEGAGLIMLGGRDSFGDGGWGETPLADVMPTTMRRGDGQIEQPGGLKVEPVDNALDAYVLQIGPTRAETAALWDLLPPITGASRIGRAKAGAVVWARTPSREDLMVAADVGAGRIIAFGGETWPWYRASEETQAAHLKFWRQAILWLAHQEDQSESRVELALDRRRVPIGGAVGFSAVARDEQERPIADARFEGTVRSPGGGAPAAVEFFAQGEGARGTYPASGEPGVYNVEVVARRPDGAEIGRASSRFLVFQDDLELENPGANIDLLRQLAELTGGEFLRPEQLDRYLGALDPEQFSRVETQVEYVLWDNWPFLVLFVAVLGLEWFLRKRMGWA